nr:hypothetical protein [Streptomyces sp. WM6372]
MIAKHHLRVSVRSVERRRRAWRAGDVEALRPAGPADSPTITGAQFAALEEELGTGPSAQGFDDERWMLTRVQTVVRRRLRVSPSVPTVWRLSNGAADPCGLPSAEPKQYEAERDWLTTIHLPPYARDRAHHPRLAPLGEPPLSRCPGSPNDVVGNRCLMQPDMATNTIAASTSRPRRADAGQSLNNPHRDRQFPIPPNEMSSKMA